MRDSEHDCVCMRLHLNLIYAIDYQLAAKTDLIINSI